MIIWNCGKANIIKERVLQNMKTEKLSKQLKYFKNTTPFIIIGAIGILAGFLIYWYSFEIWMIGTPIMVLGAVMLVLGFALRVSDQAYQSYFDNKLEAHMSGGRTGKQPDYTAYEYSFEGNRYGRLDSNQTPRSELMIRTDIYFMKNTLKLEKFRVSALEDSVVSDVFEYPLTDVSASVENREIRCGAAAKKAAIMTVSAPGCNTCEFPVKYNDIDVDKLIERINDAKNKR